jgi:Ser/Thr protein kinase RdoA (MazF antagonist)
VPELTIDDTLRQLEEVQIPDFPVTYVKRFLLDRFGFSGELTPLKSEFDQMFRCEVRLSHGYIVRISGASETEETLDFQHAVLTGIAQSDPDCRFHDWCIVATALG